VGKSIRPRYKLYVGDDKDPKCFFTTNEAMQAYLSSDVAQSARLLERQKKCWNVIKSHEADQLFK